MINVLAAITVRDGQGPAFEQLVAEARPGVLNEEGCVRYDLQRKRRSETEYVILEGWDSTAALKVHGTSETFDSFSKALEDLAVSAPQVTVLDPVGEQSALA